jgi:cytochrome c oxidase subunit 2
MTSRRLILILFAVVAGALLLAPVATADLLTPESGGSPNADDIDTLYKFVFAVAIVVFVGVEGVLLYSVFKFKARKGAIPAQIRGNTRLEIGWTVGAAVILVVLATLTFIKLDAIRNPPDTSRTGLQLADTSRRLPPSGKSLNICVNGQQYIWRYTYQNDCDPKAAKNLGAPFAYEEMVVPVDTTVTLDINAQDVAHSWWIPKLGGKMDAIPGYTNHTWFKIPAKMAGSVFFGQCAELCGRNHANMTARVRAVSVEDYQKWLAQRKADIKSAEEQGAAQRKRLGSAANSQPAGPAAAGQNPARPTDQSVESPDTQP